MRRIIHSLTTATSPKCLKIKAKLGTTRNHRTLKRERNASGLLQAPSIFQIAQQSPLLPQIETETACYTNLQSLTPRELLTNTTRHSKLRSHLQRYKTRARPERNCAST
ncbi:hypothetical protein M758_10G168200 [Ceratodon purpureus]|nr:hypothetical protein M758_10G168200 [Ceratodon purpureus]